MSSIQPTSVADSTAVSQTSVKPADSGTANNTEEVKTQQGAEDEFASYLTKSLGRSGQQEVNEEELFSAVISQRLNKESPEAAQFYDEKVKELSVSMAREDGYVPLEDVAKSALQATVDEGKIDSAKAEMINSEAFNSAQLDDNLDCLYDGRGDTSAVMSMEEAMFKVKQVLDQVDAGQLTLDPRALDIPSNIGSTPGYMIASGLAAEIAGRPADQVDSAEAVVEAEGEGSEKQVRFTWKHEASDGNLAILLPTRLNGQIDGVSLFDSDGNLLEKGDYSKQTGDKRAVYRFNDPGGDYGKNIDAVVYLENGQTLTYHVKDGGERTYVPQDDYTKKSKTQLEADMKAKHSDSSSDAGDSTSDSSGSSDATASTSSDNSGSSSDSGSSGGGSDSSGLDQSAAL